MKQTPSNCKYWDDSFYIGFGKYGKCTYELKDIPGWVLVRPNNAYISKEDPEEICLECTCFKLKEKENDK